MVYYKGFDKDLKCRGFQYEIGKDYKHDGELKLCYRGFHFCSSLQNVFSYYAHGKNSTHRFAIVKPSGEIKNGGDKLCSNELTIIKELSYDEIEEIIRIEKSEHTEKKVFCIDVVKELQSKYNFMIGGSVSLYLMGYHLYRKKVDFDIIMPYYQKMSEKDFPKDSLIEGIEEFDAKSSGNDFSSTFAITTKDGRFLKCDIRIAPSQKYETVNFKGYDFKICDLFTTLEAKLRYAIQGNEKHKDDIMTLMIKPIKHERTE
jgi:hypothetical protein